MNNQSRSGMKYLFMAVVVVICVVFYLQSGGKEQIAGLFGSAAGRDTKACVMGTSTAVVIGHQYAEQILPANSARAYAIVEQPLNATNTVYLGFSNGTRVTATTGTKLFGWFASTSTDPHFKEFGLNTDFPYVDAVTALTSTGSSTALVQECLFK